MNPPTPGPQQSPAPDEERERIEQALIASGIDPSEPKAVEWVNRQLADPPDAPEDERCPVEGCDETLSEVGSRTITSGVCPTHGTQPLAVANTLGTCSRCCKMAWEHPHDECEQFDPGAASEGERRWTIHVCPECGKKSGPDGCPHHRWRIRAELVEVVPASEAASLRQEVERLRDELRWEHEARMSWQRREAEADQDAKAANWELERAERRCAAYRNVVEKAAQPPRPDGTYNHSREALEQLAKAAQVARDDAEEDAHTAERRCEEPEERDAAAMLREFHAEADHPDTNSLWLRGTLHAEESNELIAALQEWAGATGTRVVKLGDKYPPTQDGIRKAIARELADVVYVAYGTALIAGIDLDIALREVHRANMQKVREGVRREDGKIVKGPNFKPPDLTEAIQPGRDSPALSHPEGKPDGD